MLKYKSFVNGNINDIFASLFISYFLASILFTRLIIKPFFIKKILPNESVSQLLKTFYFRNYIESFFIEFIFVIFYIINTSNIYFYLNKYFNIKFELLFLLLINSLVIIICTNLLNLFISEYKSKSEIFIFFKKIKDQSKNFFLFMNLIYINLILLLLIFFNSNNSSLPILLICIIFFTLFFK